MPPECARSDLHQCAISLLGQAHPSADEVMVLVDAQLSRTRGGRGNHHEADVAGSGLGPSGIWGHRRQ